MGCSYNMVGQMYQLETCLSGRGLSTTIRLYSLQDHFRDLTEMVSHAMTLSESNSNDAWLRPAEQAGSE
ncbi:MAG: hypothetical protein IKJ99_03550 [Oscillospiraceae bacterium]|nr:hypothetical protein [Oscillospiraceae bacterium]